MGALDRPKRGSAPSRREPSEDKLALFQYLKDNTMDGVEIYTEDLESYSVLPNHKTVKHSIRQYVDDKAALATQGPPFGIQLTSSRRPLTHLLASI